MGSMEINMITLDIQTGSREEFVDITSRVTKEIEKQGKRDGLCTVYVPHTTAAVTINEHADPSVADDIIRRLKAIVPQDVEYAHSEGNSDAHIKASMIGPAVTLVIENGRPLLGRWQGVFFCEFDGPRRRKVWLKLT
jgi:secondary thiamine-phosphate synthase enzyme